MHRILKIAVPAIVIVTLGRIPLAAQTDYRNLDDHRPVRTEDAYAIERYAFELILPYEYENGLGAEQLHQVAPEISYGLLANTQVGVKLPFAAFRRRAGTDWGFGGPRLFALHNFNTESPGLPALALRADLSLHVQLTLTAIATRSWGRTRLHLNGGATLGRDRGRPAIDPAPEWAVSLAADRTLLRQSLLLVGELGVLEATATAPTEVTTALGMRYQLTPTLVLDAGVSRRLTADAGPDLGLTLGLTHSFAAAGLMPRGAR